MIRTIHRMCWEGALLLVMSLLPMVARAQSGLLTPAAQSESPESNAKPTAEPVPEKLLVNYVEAGGSYEALTSGFGHWDGGYMRGVVVTGNHTWNAEINGQREFGDSGVYMAAGDTYNFNSDWYGSVTVGSSAGGFFWPRVRVDAFVNRKWSERKQFITTAGFGYYAAKDIHRDRSFFAGSTYYFTKPWILEEGIRFNLSNPGGVFSPAGFVALTQGSDKHHYITLNVGAGEEAYQIVGVTSVLTRFQSQTATLTWRQWIGKSWGFNFVADYYHSPFYHRNGGSLGFFREF